MYFPKINMEDGTLIELEMCATQMRNLRVNRASTEDARWLASVLTREGKVFGTKVVHSEDIGKSSLLRLVW
jgi:poly-gamma-glutamate synthesis protein (capsule biosynthesis protein)